MIRHTGIIQYLTVRTLITIYFSNMAKIKKLTSPAILGKIPDYVKTVQVSKRLTGQNQKLRVKHLKPLLDECNQAVEDVIAGRLKKQK